MESKIGGLSQRLGSKCSVETEPRCSAENCTNMRVQGGLGRCHGAKAPRCSVEGCNNQVVRGGVCHRHGAKATRCSVEGCNNQAKCGGLCNRHAGKKCIVEGCANQDVRGRVCHRHRAKDVNVSSQRGKRKEADHGDPELEDGELAPKKSRVHGPDLREPEAGAASTFPSGGEGCPAEKGGVQPRRAIAALESDARGEELDSEEEEALGAVIYRDWAAAALERAARGEELDSEEEDALGAVIYCDCFGKRGGDDR